MNLFWSKWHNIARYISQNIRPKRSSKESIMKRAVLVILTIVFLIAVVPAAQATVETGWPVSKPNTCKSTDDFFINFESGIDGVQIESTIPTMEFTTTLGNDWEYGDIRTGGYNVDSGGSEPYKTRGNFFAWLDTTGDVGRITFLGGGASYCSVLVSSAGLQLDAYDDSGTKIADSGWAGDNRGTNTFTRLTVEAPAGKTIAYVEIHDTGNFWVMDELCTNANKVVIPVPGRTIGSHSDRFDMIFVPDTDYGSPANIDTWLPTFIQDIQNNIDQRLLAADPVTGEVAHFNFYYTRVQGDSVYPTHYPPTDLTRVAPYANAIAILHKSVFSDWTNWGPPSTYSAEGVVGRSFIHESGHAIFGLADEYNDAPDCTTARFQPDPMPNVWDTQTDCTTDTTNEGWTDMTCDTQPFTTCKGDWWKLGTTEFIMEDGDHFVANGWGRPAARRINWWLTQPGSTGGGAGPSPEAEKSIWMNLHVSNGVFSLVDQSYIVDSPPEYLPGKYDFSAKIFSSSGVLLGEYGIYDPRIVQAEKGYAGPTWRDDVDFQLIVPYFIRGDRVDLIETATESVKTSVDISDYASFTPDTTPPIISMVSPPSGSALQDGVTFKANVADHESGVASVTFSIREANGGTGIPIGFENLVPDYDSATGIATLTFDTLKLPDGNYLVVVSATNGDGKSGSIKVPYSIRNWAVLKMLPATPNSNAGRTMPIKFAIKVAASVDPAQPFVYNDDLTIKIFVTSNPGNVLQTSKFGSGARDYRIENNKHYITNFQTSKVPMQYTVEIWRNNKNFLVGSFTFKTVK